ncbi:hypothetical protein P7C70_g2765, partial [Phenoliferia sp. Uapishka_3]
MEPEAGEIISFPSKRPQDDSLSHSDSGRPSPYSPAAQLQQRQQTPSVASPTTTPVTLSPGNTESALRARLLENLGAKHPGRPGSPVGSITASAIPSSPSVTDQNEKPATESQGLETGGPSSVRRLTTSENVKLVISKLVTANISTDVLGSLLGLLTSILEDTVGFEYAAMEADANGLGRGHGQAAVNGMARDEAEANFDKVLRAVNSLEKELLVRLPRPASKAAPSSTAPPSISAPSLPLPLPSSAARALPASSSDSNLSRSVSDPNLARKGPNGAGPAPYLPSSLGASVPPSLSGPPLQGNHKAGPRDSPAAPIWAGTQVFTHPPPRVDALYDPLRPTLPPANSNAPPAYRPPQGRQRSPPPRQRSPPPLRARSPPRDPYERERYNGGPPLAPPRPYSDYGGGGYGPPPVQRYDEMDRRPMVPMDVEDERRREWEDRERERMRFSVPVGRGRSRSPPGRVGGPQWFSVHASVSLIDSPLPFFAPPNPYTRLGRKHRTSCLSNGHGGNFEAMHMAFEPGKDSIPTVKDAKDLLDALGSTILSLEIPMVLLSDDVLLHPALTDLKILQLEAIREDKCPLLSIFSPLPFSLKSLHLYFQPDHLNLYDFDSEDFGGELMDVDNLVLLMTLLNPAVSNATELKMNFNIEGEFESSLALVHGGGNLISSARGTLERLRLQGLDYDTYINEALRSLAQELQKVYRPPT